MPPFLDADILEGRNHGRSLGHVKGKVDGDNITRTTDSATIGGLAPVAPKAPCRVFDSIDYQVAVIPDAPAVQYESNKAVTYRELSELADRIAHVLSFRKGTIVPICMDLSANLIATIVAILRSGAAYLVLDPAGSVNRNNSIVADSSAKVVVVDKDYAPFFENSVVLEAALSDRVNKDGTIERFCDTTVSDPAYLIYTSGSTGTMKGVVLTHESVSLGIAHFSLREKSRWLLFYNPIFSAAQRTILATLSKGACLCLASRDKLTTSLLETIAKMRVDALGITPSALSLLSADKTPSCLRHISTVGEPLDQKTADEWAERVELRVSYGLSECAQLNFARLLRKGENPRVLGAPSDTTRAYVLEPRSLKQLPMEKVGELCLAGPQIAQGYYKRGQQTATSFKENPFGTGRLYRTGDLAVQHRDQMYEIIGRLDFQVKIHGQRLEPAEISTILSRSPYLKALAVVGADIKGRTSLVAALVPVKDADWSEVVQSLRQQARKSLPFYMIPSYWLKLDELPVNPNGKLDILQIRRVAESTSIESMLGNALENSSESEIPTDSLELAIRDAWATSLGLSCSVINRSSSFLELGGSSMDAIQVVRKLRLKGIEVGLGDVLRSQSLSDLKVTLLAGTSSQPATEDPARLSLVEEEGARDELRSQKSVDDAYSPTPLQRSLLTSTLQGNKDYLYQRTFDVRHLDLVKLKLAFQIIFFDSEILRTTYTYTNAGIVQVIRNDFPLPWKHVSMPWTEFKKRDKEEGVQSDMPLVRFTILDKQLLVVSMHHSLFDFWSHHFIYEDVARLYLGHDMIKRPPFRNFVNHLQRVDPKPANEFWRSYLAQAEPCILNHSPGAENNSRSRYFSFDIRGVKRALGVTSGPLIYSAWAIVLARHTGLTEATFATTIAGRELPLDNVQALDGPTLTVVPQKLQVNPKNSLAETVRSAHDSFWEVLKHSQHGMRRVLKAVDQQYGKLFDTLVNILVKPNGGELYSDQIFQAYGSKPTWQTEWTTLDVEEDESGFLFRLIGPMPQRQIDFVLDQLMISIWNITENANAKVESIDLIGEEERSWLLCAEYAVAARPQKLHDRFEAMVARYPDNIAIQWQKKESIKYIQLDSLANQMSAYLVQRGVKPGDLIPLLLDKSPMMIIAIIALLKVGAAYVPLSSDNPVERNMFIVREIKAEIVLTENAHRNYFPSDAIAPLMLDQTDLSRHSEKKLEIEVSPGNLAYVIYTSGSTGQPKGVMVKHESAAAAIESIMAFEGRCDSDGKSLQFSNYVFDVSVYDIFVPLSSGQTLCMAPTDRLLSDLPSVINEMDVSHCFLTPTVARVLDPQAVPTLKTVTVGGEPVTSDVIEAWSEDHKLMNGYGPTETSIIVTMKDIYSDTNPKDIGRPLPTVRAFIIEPNGHRLTPWGAIGELCFSGPQLAEGYIAKPEQTAASFLEYGIDGVTRIYRTGDLGRWLPSGHIECLGRKDHQVKIKGHRVELGEVEQALLKASCIRDSAVIIAELNGTTQLLAFVVFKDTENDCNPSAEDLFDELQVVKQSLKGLAYYMRPKYFVPVKHLPKLLSGKVDRKELKKMANSMDSAELSQYTLDKPRHSTKVTPPQSENQKLLREAWARILGHKLESLGLEADFLNMGGDSVGAINLASHLRQNHYTLSVGDALKYTTLEGMAEHIKYDRSYEKTEEKAFTPPLQVQEAFRSYGLKENALDYIYPCPPGQTEFLTQGARTEQYWVVMTVRLLDKSTNIEKWLQAVEQLAETNEILRTTFVRYDGLWYGAVLKDAKPMMDILDISSEDAKSEAIQKVWGSRFKSGGPFIRYNLLRMPDGTHEAVIKMDHGLYDGTLLRIFDEHFKAFEHGQPVPTITPFHDFALQVWASKKDHALKFWTQSTQRPTSFQYPKIGNPTISSMHVLTTTMDLEPFTKSTGQTPSIVFQAAFQIWLALRSSCDDVAFDYLCTGRNVNLPNPQQINGPCANFLPLRSQIHFDQSLNDYLSSTQTSFWQAAENGIINMDDIYSACDLERRMTTNTALFLFQPFDPPKDADEREMRWVVMAKSKVTMPQPYGVVFEIVRIMEGFKFKFAYDERVWNKEEARIEAEMLRKIVGTMLEDERANMKELIEKLIAVGGLESLKRTCNH